MIKQMLDILVCPYDKETELELFEFSIRKEKDNPSEKSSNSEKKNNDLDSLTVIEEGLLFCKSCSRFYPIVEEIPIILPDNLRDKNKDIEVLKKWSHLLPEKIIKNGQPWHL